MRIVFVIAFFCSLLTSRLNAKDYSLVFVYLGENLADYLDYTVAQARLFNKNCNIFLIANESATHRHAGLVDRLKETLGVQVVKCEELKKSEAHKAFEERCRAYSIFSIAYWKYVTERFFYIDELMNQYNLRDVFQIECDVMLYADLSHYIPLLHEFYPGMAAPFENDYVASVSFVYFSKPSAIADFVQFIPKHLVGPLEENDMYLLASYKNARTDQEIDHLPTISKDYIRNWPLRSVRGDVPAKSWKYWNHIEKWESFFDHDSLGLLLKTQQWEAKQAIFDPAPYFITWEADQEGRKVPYAYYSYTKQKYRINTIHVPHHPLANFEAFRSNTGSYKPEWRGSKWQN